MFRFIWLQNSQFNEFQLDIVGFLAILGEGSLEPIAQVATLSHLVYLPRLIPAPQTFLKTARPEKLETSSNARVVGVYSGNAGENIHHVAHALHRGDKLRPNEVQCVRVTEDLKKPRPSPKRYGPLAILAILGFCMAIILFAISLHERDGFALLATIALSFLSTVTGIANKWAPTPNEPKPLPDAPEGDVVIKYPQGAFIIVKCSEETARYLYFNPSERCHYLIKSTPVYRLLSLFSTLLLITGVICLANAKIQSQTAFAGAYVLINIFYWIGAALPPANHWDLSRLKLTRVTVHGGAPPRDATVKDVSTTYTEALWKTIAVTGTTDWLFTSGWTPKTSAWEDWLREAREAAEEEPMKPGHDKSGGEIWRIKDWDCRKALQGALKRSTTEKGTPVVRYTNSFPRHPPLREV